MPAEPGRRRGTVRARVTAAAAVTVLLVLVLTSAVLVEAHRRALTSSLEESITVVADDAAGRVRRGDVSTPRPSVGDDDGFLQIVGADGTVVSASDPRARREPVLAPLTSGGTRWRTVEPPFDDVDYRVRSIIAVSPEGSLTVHVGAPLDDVKESVELLGRSLAAAAPAVSALLALLVWVLVGRTLRPVEDIRAQVSAIGGDDLGRRVPEPPTDDEIGRLARTMNEMLERIELAAEQQRRFAADASHELRSPLTRMRAELEVDAAHPGGADPYATHRSVLEELGFLQQLVEDLLLLARLDAAPRRPEEPVSLDEVVEQCVARLPKDAVEVSTDLEVVIVVGDGGQLRRLVSNLLDNAINYAAARVEVQVGETAGQALLRVSDDGPGVPATERVRIFERFARVDEARSGGGTGLGLSIALEIARRHGGGITVEDRPGGGASFVVTLRSGR